MPQPARHDNDRARPQSRLHWSLFSQYGQVQFTLEDLEEFVGIGMAFP